MDHNEEILSCHECESSVKGYHRFCYNCGAYLGSNAEKISIFNNNKLQNAFFFYLIYLFVCLTVKYTNWFDSYDNLFWVELLLGGVTILFAATNSASIKPLLRFNNFSW